MSDTILGISAFYHDSAAALLVDGKIAAAAQEERFTRKKHDPSFPVNAIRYVLAEGGVSVHDLKAISFYDKPLLKFERLIDTYHSFAPKGLKSFLAAMPVWIKEKLFMKKMLWDELENIEGSPLKKRPCLHFPEHHLSHAASAYYPSPFDEAAILTIDGVGEWATSTIGHGNNGTITLLREICFPHSVGLIYSAFTYYCGFKVNSGEYKLMGLAPYGNPESDDFRRYKKFILEELIDIRDDGSILLNMEYFDYATGLRMCKDEKWIEAISTPPREAESELTQPYMDMALAIQHVTEEIVLRLATTARNLTGSRKIVMAGGVCLNCVANGKLLKSGIFDDIWIQPAAGDAGGALGAAYVSHFSLNNFELEKSNGHSDQMQGAYLGPEYSDIEVRRLCRRFKAPSKFYENFDELCDAVARLLSEGQIVGWFQGRMEFGPRALGNRSIIGDPRQADMQKRLNLKIKYREGFRPFAPSVMIESVDDYFELGASSPYMLLVAPVSDTRKKPLPEGYEKMKLYERLYHLRSDIPAITHVDYSARIQTVHKDTNERYWSLINAFKSLTGYGVIVNTSFNVRGEPIVCTPEDAYRCFMRTEMDWLVINNFLFDKSTQPKWHEKTDWQEEFVLD